MPPHFAGAGATLGRPRSVASVLLKCGIGGVRVWRLLRSGVAFWGLGCGVL